uniref:Uncharacterized protein n=1 Tax=Kalanchoe fedtschenkoi TaxID=63787 RepID=A0A7N0UJX2_KALFE
MLSGFTDYALGILREKLRGVDADSAKILAVESLKELWLALSNLAAYVHEKSCGHLILSNFVAHAVEMIDEKCPQKTREEWLRASMPWLMVVLMIVSIVLVLRFFCRKKRPVKMMKAPGRNHRMPRRDFASNPKKYFRELRGK